MDKQDFIFWAQKLQNTYVPSEKVRSHLANVDLIAIVGPTGVGKSALVEKLGLPYVISDATRDPRPGERDHHDYNFRKDYLDIVSELEQAEFVQFYVSKFGEFYGTHLRSYPEKGKAIMPIVAKQIDNFAALGFKTVTPIYIMPPSYPEWLRRMGNDRANELKGRLREAAESIVYAQENQSKFHFVLNDSLDLALRDIQAILDGKEADKHRSMLAEETIDVLLRYLEEE